jgi:ribosomal protein S13
MDYVLREAAGFGITVGNKILSDLDFADDVALLEMTKQRLQELLNKVSVKAEKVGLNINIDKTKSMATSGSPVELLHKNRRVEQVHEFKYLGSWVDYWHGKRCFQQT